MQQPSSSDDVVPSSTSQAAPSALSAGFPGNLVIKGGWVLLSFGNPVCMMSYLRLTHIKDIDVQLQLIVINAT